MAFNAVGLQQFNMGGAIGSGAGSVKSLWFYATNDADTVVEANAYFDTTALNIGDILISSQDIDGTPEAKIYVVSVGTGDISSNNVTIVPMKIA